MTTYASADEAYRAGWDAATVVARDERNRLARLCADANDERDEERRKHADTRNLLSIRDDDLDRLCDEFKRVTGRDWIDEQTRSWFG
jgi:hypothetical protein